MEKFLSFKGIGVPLRRTNVDTDQIIPAEFLKRVTKTGFEDALFQRWRQEPDFILNRDPYRNGTVLVAGADFGTGSSREHAVWALRDYGFRVVISPRFADIFRGNSGKQGLLTAVVPESVIEQLWMAVEANPGTEIKVDLESRTLECGEIKSVFEIDDYTRWRLMEGLDDIGLTLRHESEIDEFESRREPWRPKTLPAR